MLHSRYLLSSPSFTFFLSLHTTLLLACLFPRFMILKFCFVTHLVTLRVICVCLGLGLSTEASGTLKNRTTPFPEAISKKYCYATVRGYTWDACSFLFMWVLCFCFWEVEEEWIWERKEVQGSGRSGERGNCGQDVLCERRIKRKK